MDQPLFQQIVAALPGDLGQLTNIQPVSGGDINQAFKLTTPRTELFVKLNQPHRLAMFEEEVKGLKAIANTQAIRTPQVMGCGTLADHCYLALHWHSPVPPTNSHWRQLGEQLAQLHQMDVATHFGWPTDNFIGSSPQLNTAHSSWGQFFAQQRIKPQLEWLAVDLPCSVEEICHKVEECLFEVPLQPALLHGDLWSGNVMFDASGPLLIDPACYWGDAEADIAMTHLFGGFPSTFYQAYRSNNGNSSQSQHDLYNLYHLLNHANLFGGHYVAQSLQLLKKLLG